MLRVLLLSIIDGAYVGGMVMASRNVATVGGILYCANEERKSYPLRIG